MKSCLGGREAASAERLWQELMNHSKPLGLVNTVNTCIIGHSYCCVRASDLDECPDFELLGKVRILVELCEQKR